MRDAALVTALHASHCGRAVTMDDTERTEFIGAVVQLTRAIEQILKLTERLRGMSPIENDGFSAQELVDARAQVALWRQQVDALTTRVASLTVQPPDRPQ